MTRSVIFDCDGVLVDTELIANRVLASLLTEAGIPTTFDDCMHDYRGRAMAAVIEAATQQLGGPLPFDVAERYYAGALSLPVFPEMGDGDVKRVVEALTEALPR